MKPCAWCLKETLNPKYCSNPCSTKATGQEIRNRPPKTKPCQECGEVFTYGSRSGTSRTSKNVYCNSSCAAKANNPKRGKSKTCGACGERFIGAGKKYCNHECWLTSIDVRKKERVKVWIEGHRTIACGDKSGLTSWARDYMLSSNNNACCSCGWNELHPADSLPLVEIDHIDGDSSNNAFDNLRVLCRNCHSLTLSFGGRNKGKGRQSKGLNR